MEGLIVSAILYACFYLYGFILDIQQIRRRRGKRTLNWFELLIRSPWWAAKILIRMLPAILIWFFGLILFNWILGFAYSSIDAAFLGSGWKMSFVNFPPALLGRSGFGPLGPLVLAGAAFHASWHQKRASGVRLRL